MKCDPILVYERLETMEQDVTAAARHHLCAVEDIKIGLDYPEDFEW
jgi:hypothetical protein